jgi:HD superfamily phosphohydrolase
MSLNRKKYEIRDVIHGLIERSPLEVQVINTAVFQRLRRIFQLALANLVYPGAHHTRLEHCLGTMHVAGRIADRLNDAGKITEDELINIRLAALLHDIGHGPFSHVSEYLLRKYYVGEKVEIGKNMEKIHELVTEDIIKNDDDLEKILSGEQREAIIELLHKGGRKDFKSDIVSGPLDADKLDYLLRDNYHTGVKYGLFDLDKIIESLRIIKFGVEETYLGISEEGIYALEQFIMAKYHMTTQVYFHRIRGITDCMIIRGIETAVDEGLDEVKYIYQYDGTKDFMKRYCEYNDGNLTESIRKKGGKLSREIFDRLYNRRFLKLIHNRRLSDISGIKLKDRYTNFEATDKKELEKRIAEKMKVDPALVIINIFDIKKPIGRPEGFSINDDSILVDLEGKEPEEIKNVKWSIFNFEGAFKTPELRVHAPYDKLTNIVDKQKQREYKKLDDMVCKILYS